jgi:aspartate/methionine/tyrosine aminotransferase
MPSQAKAHENDASPKWEGRFPYNEIISLLDVNRTFNLAESTSQDLTVGELMDLAGLANIRDLKLGYGTSTGAVMLRDAIADVAQVPADHVITTQGTALGLFLLAFELCREGDEAVLATPCFPPSRDTLLGLGVKVREVPLSFDNGYRMDFDRLKESLSARTKLVSFASPQNPSGVQIPHEVVKQILALLDRHAPQAVLFVDETYREAAYGSTAAMASVASLDPRIVTGSSVSKALGAPGLRTGWLTVPQATLRARLAVAKMNIVLSGSVLDEVLAAALLRNRADVLAPRRYQLSKALKDLEDWRYAERHRVAWVRPDAGALCCLRLNADAFNDICVSRFWELLPGRDLQLAPGLWFGESSRVFRLGFGYLPADRLRPALDALSQVMTTAVS